MALDYALALGIQGAGQKARRKTLLIASLMANLGILIIFKYSGFFAGLWSGVTGTGKLTLDFVLPFGISFYTFHAMSYVIDVYRGTIRAERNFTYYSAYVMFFPQLVAGPIARASHLLHQFSEPKRLRYSNFTIGSLLIAKGYFLKAVLADHLSPMVDAFLGDSLSGSPLLTLQGIYFFAFQIYFDFSGYTHIARGVAKLFGFDLVLNFNRPYSAASITEFWRRWHISLSTWLRDYLYISLGGNRYGKWRTYWNLMITMLLGGLWHGAGFNFLIWGGLHGLFLATEKAMAGNRIGDALRSLPRWIRVLATFHLVCFAWIFFRSASLQGAMQVLGRLGAILTVPNPVRFAEINAGSWIMVLAWMAYEWAEQRFALPARYVRVHWSLRFGLLFVAILCIDLFAQANPRAFIYFQF